MGADKLRGRFTVQMNIFKHSSKHFYVLSCFLLMIVLSGCKEKGNLMLLFEGIPDSTYMSEIKSALENKKPLVIAFTAEWCPHCRKYKPVFFDVKNSLESQAQFINIDVDDKNGSALSGRFQVRGIPTTAFVRSDGSVFKIQSGEIEKENLEKLVNDLIKSRKKRRSEPVAPFPFPIQAEETKTSPEVKPEVKPEIKTEEKQESNEVKPDTEVSPDSGSTSDQDEEKTEDSMNN